MLTTRKRKASSEEPPQSVEESSKPQNSKSKKKSSKRQSESPPAIVGGPNGDYRITGTESDSSLYKTFNIPAENDKVIPCQLHGPDPKSSSDVKHLFIFTHGAGGGIENPATKLFAEGYATTGMPILCFQGTMNLKNRVKSFETVLEHCKQEYPDCDFVVGGRSMGARAAIMLAGEREEIGKVVAVSYPLVSPKGEVRDETLVDLERTKKVCFLSGDKDNMCDWETLEKVRGKMAAGTKIVAVKNADHGMSLVGAGKDKAKAVEEIRRAGGQVAAQWLRGEHDSDEQIELRWNGESGKAVVGSIGAQEDESREEEEVCDKEEEQSDLKEKPVAKKRGRKSDTDRKAQSDGRDGKSKSLPDKDKHERDKEEATITPRRSKRNKS